MNNEALVTPCTNPSAWDEPGSAHPAGDIRLPQQSTVGRRARLLAGLDGLACDVSTVIETTCSMSWV